jgi:imidazolonepropionase-like amidohydrolase
MIADSPDEVRMRVRETTMQGASQIKLTAGGGVSSRTATLDAITFTERRVARRVQAAGNGARTSRCMRTRTKRFARRSMPGVKCIEHGSLMDDKTAQLIKTKGIC